MKDVSGDKGKNNNTLTSSWLSSSLKIAPDGQVAFLQKFIDNKLPVSVKSQELTRNILFIEDLPEDWKLYGKTGSCSYVNPDGSHDEDYKVGRFVGWIQKDTRTIAFSHHIEDRNKQATFVSNQARELAREKLVHLIKEENRSER
ncbi:MAG: penicillin-binding transpeptidase domain-containing protein [Candidatus Midichloria sp.]